MIALIACDIMSAQCRPHIHSPRNRRFASPVKRTKRGYDRLTGLGDRAVERCAFAIMAEAVACAYRFDVSRLRDVVPDDVER